MNLRALLLLPVGVVPMPTAAGPLELHAALEPSNKPYTEPARAAYTKPSGGAPSTYSVMAGLFWTGTLPRPEHPIEIKVGTEVAKDTTLAKPLDTRSLKLAGSLEFDLRSHPTKGVTSYTRPSLQVEYKDNDVKDAQSVGARLEVPVVDQALAVKARIVSEAEEGIPIVWLLPTFGLYGLDVQDAALATDLSTSFGAYLKAELFTPRTSVEDMGELAVTHLYISEIDSTTRPETESAYTKFTARYFFKSSQAEGAQPSVSISRVIGEDLLKGLERQAYTELALELTWK